MSPPDSALSTQYSALVLANSDYRNHVTDEGEQLQEGLRKAGWELAGFGYGDGCVDVPTLLERHQPRIVLVTAREDWDEHSPGCFDRRCSFRGMAALAARPDVFKVQVVKDCPGPVDRRKGWCEEIQANAVVLYYHPRSMASVSPWLCDYPLVRTWHTVDRECCSRLLGPALQRAGAIVTGAKSAAYPLRSLAIDHARKIGLGYSPHPGYKVRRCHTPEYLKILSHYRVHLATASVYGFTLRKIIESVAVGCTPLTDLPDYDVLPEIDGALARIDSRQTPETLRNLVQHHVTNYDAAARIEWARRCLDFYDFRTRARALSEELHGLL